MPDADAPVGRLPTIVEAMQEGRLFYAVPSPQGSEIKGGLHSPGPPVEIDGDRAPDHRHAEAFADWARRRYAGAGPPVDAYGCIYTWLPEDRFHLERHDRVVIVSCCSGRGFKFIPRIGARGGAGARSGGLILHDPRR